MKMSRPKKDTPEGKIASIKWHKTMEEKYGGKKGVYKLMQKNGRKGGLKPTTKLKGFAANPEMAKIAGSKGGRVSKRGKLDYRKKWAENREVAIAMYDGGHSAREIGEILDIPTQSVSYYLKKEK